MRAVQAGADVRSGRVPVPSLRRRRYPAAAR